MCKFQVELSIIFNYINWTNQINAWRNLRLTWNHKTHHNSNLGKIITCLPIYIYIYIYIYDIDPCETISKWQKCVNFEIEHFDFCNFENSSFFHMISKFDNITYNTWKRLFNVTLIFLVKLNLISQICITCNLIMYQQKKST
jgi:hypothetical protein